MVMFLVANTTTGICVRRSSSGGFMVTVAGTGIGRDEVVAVLSEIRVVEVRRVDAVFLVWPAPIVDFITFKKKVSERFRWMV